MKHIVICNIINKIKNIGRFLPLLLVLMITACSDPYKDQAYATVSKDELPLATYLSTRSDFTQWTTLLKYTDLYNTMNLQQSYTAFIPNDSAMNVYLKNNGYTSVTDIPEATAKTLVKYHTIAGTEYSVSDFTDGNIPDTTATGDFLTISSDNATFYVNGEAAILSHVSVSNAKMHELGNVLTPITKTLSEQIESNPKLSIFSDAMKATGLYNQLLSKTSSYTAFVTPDSIYNKSGITSLNGLISYLGAGDGDYTNSDNELYRYVAYHLMDSQESYNDLSDFSTSSTTNNISTMAEGKLITLYAVNDALYFNYNTDSVSKISIIKKNISCKNGYMHILNGVMPISTPLASTTTWEFTAYSEISSLFSSVYRLKTLTTASVNYITTDDSVSCYTWEAFPASNQDNSVAYYVPIKSSSVMIKATNYDYLRLTLGQFGLIQMTTPTLVEGTYKITFNHYNPHNSSTAASSNAQLTIFIDGTEVGTVQTTGYSSSTDYFLKTSLSNITFSSTKTHAVKIMADDNNTSYIDAMTFTPVN